MSFYLSNNVFQGTFLAGLTALQDSWEAHAVFSINASNQLRGTFWLTQNGSIVTASLDNGSYVLFDVDGNLVAGISELNIVPDLNGFYEITPVSAAPLYDLTHYVAKISISKDSQTYTSYRGITLAEV